MAGFGVGVHHQVVRGLVSMIIPRTNQLAIVTPSPAMVRGDSRGPQTVFWVPDLKQLGFGLCQHLVLRLQ